MSLGNKNNPISARMTGVRVAQDATGNSGRGTPLRVTHVAKAECVFIGYNDEQGRAVSALFFKIGDEYYAPPDTTAWCNSLRPMTDWMKPLVTEQLKDQEPVDVPDKDSVDVMAGG